MTSSDKVYTVTEEVDNDGQGSQVLRGSYLWEPSREKSTADPRMDSGSEIRMAQTADPLFGSTADKYTLPDILV